MTEQKFYEKLKPLEPAMENYLKTNGGGLTATEVGVLKELYPTLQIMTNQGLPRVFKASCSTCVREVFAVYASVYYRLKAGFEKAAGVDKNNF